MAGVYLTELANWLREAGLTVVEYDGWKTRARSSGGYAPGRPWCVMWHHTASGPASDGISDARYIVSAPTAPIANLYLQRNGTVWVIAAGATNTNGKGNSLRFSKGTVPADSMNLYALGVEMANDGVGEPWPQAQVDAMFTLSNVINAKLGNLPSDVSTHANYAPGRKIDPARASSVQGPWRPRGVGAGDTWNNDDVRAECVRRANQVAPEPVPDPVPPLPPGIPNPSIEVFGMYLLGVKIPNAPGDGILGLRVSADLVVHEPNADAYGIDKWLGVPYKECGDADAAKLFVGRRATGPCPVADPASGWYSEPLARAWRQ